MKLSTLCKLAVVSSTMPAESAAGAPPRKGRRIKRALILLVIVLLLLCALAGAAYWQIVQLSRRQLISELLDVARNMDGRKEFTAARELYMRAAKVNTKSPDKAIAMEGAAKIQFAADSQAAERAENERQIAEIRSTLADLQMRKQGVDGDKARLDREVQTLDSAKARLSDQLNQLQERMSRENNEKYVGQTGVVHIEDCDTRGEPVCYGKFSNFKMVYVPGTPELIGTFVPVRVLSVRKNSLTGTIEE